MSRARRLVNGTADGRKRRTYAKGLAATPGPWLRLREVVKAGTTGKAVDRAELDALIVATGQTPPRMCGRGESQLYAQATALRDRLTEEN